MPCVDIVAMFGSADGSLMRYAVDQGAKGIVVQAVGMGSMNVSMFEALKYALSKGVPVVISTRVYNGRTRPVYGFVGGSKTSDEAGAVMAGDLSQQKARLLLIGNAVSPSRTPMRSIGMPVISAAIWASTV